MASPTVLGAIYQQFLGNAALVAAAPGSPYDDEAPEGSDIAAGYVVITDFAEKSELMDFEGGHEAEARWTFVVVKVGLAATEALALLVRAAFDSQTLAVTGRTVMRVNETGYRPRMDLTRSTDDRRVYEARLDYYADTRR